MSLWRSKNLNQMNGETPQDSLIAEFKRRVMELFPNIPITEWGYGLDFTVGFGGANGNLSKSEYFIDSIAQTYFHLTTYRSLFAIVNTGTFRLYNLKNSNDENELDSFRDLAFTKEGIDRSKEGIFTLSFCHEANLQNPQLWDAYGQVAVVFEIMNSPIDWEYYHLANIQYQTNPAFRRFFELKKELQQRIKVMQFTHDSIRDLIAFHKIPNLNWEREVRLMHVPLQHTNHMDQFYDFKTSDHHTGFTKYVELALFVDPTPPRIRNFTIPKLKHDIDLAIYYSDRPKIKIKSIVFGDNEPRINQQKFNGLHTEIQSYIEKRFGHQIDIPRQLFTTGLTTPQTDED